MRKYLVLALMNGKLEETKMSILIVLVQFFKRPLNICHHSIDLGLLFILLTNEFFYFIVKNNGIDYFFLIEFRFLIRLLPPSKLNLLQYQLF